MIKVNTNPNFSNWFQVVSFGHLVDEFNKRAKAMKFAESLAKSTHEKYIVVDGKPVPIKLKD